MTVDSLGRVLAISPHLDDAVLSAGALLAAAPGSVVLTVFAGCPSSYGALSEWDGFCGFAEGDDVVALRRDEDRRATAQLGAQARWLDFLDEQYDEERPSPKLIADAIRLELASLDVDTVALPLGIYHRDHQLTHEACALLLENDFDRVAHWVAWADVPYRARHPELLAEQVESLAARGFELVPWTVAADGRKHAAIAEYTTQIRGLGTASIADTELPEQFYSLRRS